MSPLRVLWITQSYPSPADAFSGGFHQTQAEAMARLGVKIDVVAAIPWVPPLLDKLSKKWLAYKLAPRWQETAGVSIHRPRFLALPKGNVWAWPHLCIARGLRDLNLERPDVIHAHFAYPSGLVATGLARELQVPCILTLHGSDVNVYPTLNRLSHGRFTRAVCNATAVTAVSKALVERTLAISGREPLLMPIGVDLRAYNNLPEKADARRALGLPLDKFLVLFVGFITEAKGIRVLTQALERLQDSSLEAVLVGNGPLLNEVRDRPGVHAVGFQPREKVPTYMAAADALVLPSDREGLPTVLVEAGAAGLPVIATRVGGIPELLADNRGRIITPGSVVELAGAIERLRGDTAATRQSAERLKEYVAINYNVDTNARHFIDLYSNLMAASTSTGIPKPEGKR